MGGFSCEKGMKTRFFAGCVKISPFYFAVSFVIMEIVTPAGKEYKEGDVLSVTQNELTVRRHLEENKTDVMTIKRCNNIDEAGEIFAQTLSKKLGK